MFQRARTTGTTAVVRARTRTAIFAVEDLSPAGARVCGALSLAYGELITILFAVDGCPLTMHAVVTRVEPGDPSNTTATISFRDVSPVIHAFVQRLVEKAQV